MEWREAILVLKHTLQKWLSEAVKIGLLAFGLGVVEYNSGSP